MCGWASWTGMDYTTRWLVSLKFRNIPRSCWATGFQNYLWNGPLLLLKPIISLARVTNASGEFIGRFLPFQWLDRSLDRSKVTNHVTAATEGATGAVRQITWQRVRFQRLAEYLFLPGYASSNLLSFWNWNNCLNYSLISLRYPHLPAWSISWRIVVMEHILYIHFW